MSAASFFSPFFFKPLSSFLVFILTVLCKLSDTARFHSLVTLIANNTATFYVLFCRLVYIKQSSFFYQALIEKQATNKHDANSQK